MSTEEVRADYTDMEFDSFPDLTGLSPSAKSDLSGFAEAHETLSYREAELVDFCLKESVAVEELFQAAWSKLLASITGEQDVLFLYWSRQDETLPVKTSAKPCSTSKEVISAIRRNREIPKSDVNKLFRVRDLMDREGDGAPSLTGLVCFVKGPDTSVQSLGGHLSVRLDIAQTDGVYTLSLRYRCSLILTSDAPRLLAIFEDAVSSIIGDIDAPFLSWNKPAARASLSVSNPSPVALKCSMGETVHSFVEFYAREQPQAIALEFLHTDGSRTKWSYARLDHIADAIADVLLSQFGVQSEEAVPVCVSKTPAFYACILAVMKTGATFTPFTNTPGDRKKFMFEELGAKLALCIDGEDMSWCTPEATLNVSELMNRNSSHGSLPKSSRRRPQVMGSNLVYQMYTSGSTGRPKAVDVEHRNAVQTIMASKDLLPWKKSSRMLQYAAPSFDMCYYDTFLAWGLGITLCSATDAAVYNNLTGVINTLQTDLLGLTPSVATTLNPKELPGVRWLYCIGEAMLQTLVDSWQGRLVNSYGPTEATQMVTLSPVDVGVKASVIGRPFPNTSFFVLQKNSDSILPALSAGELCIGGPQVARGYHANPEKTRSSFVYVDGMRMYRTGDMVRMLGCGAYEFLGRVDDQVKIRGQRVELGEINQALIRADKVISQASSQIIKVNEKGKEQLVSFIVLRQKLSAEEQQEVQHAALASLRGALPPYMVPKIVLAIESLPLSASRKIDRKALASILMKSLARKTDDEVGSALESWAHESQLIKHAYATVCGASPDAITQSATIFELGIDSISAIRVASLLQGQNLSVNASDVLEHPSIHSLSSYLSTNESSSKSNEPSDESFDFNQFDAKHRSSLIQSSGSDGSNVAAVRPCTTLQSGMIAQTMHSDTPLYFNHIRYVLRTDFNMQALKRSLGELVERYELLRTGFGYTKDPRFPIAMITYNQHVHALPLRSINSDVFNSSQTTKQLQQDFKNDMKVPPWVLIVEERTMHLIAHHSLYDAQVLEIWIRDLALAYSGRTLSSAVPFESQLSRLLHVDSQSQQLSDKFWTDLKESLPPTKFPCLTPLKSSDLSFVGVSRQCSLNLSTVEDLCKKRGITLQVAGQVAWGTLLASYVGDDAVTFGTVLSGRTTEESHEVGFPCITTLPTPFNAGVDLQIACDNLLAFNAKAHKHQYTPLKRIERLAGRTNDALFDTIFTLQRKSGATMDAPNPFQYLDNYLVIDYPVSVELEPTESGQLHFHLYHRLDCIPQIQANLILDQLETIFCGTICNGKGTIHPSIASADRTLYSVTPALEPELPCPDDLLHKLFERSARMQPNRSAFEHVLEISETSDEVSRRCWTFAQVETEGNKVANFLIRHGVKVGSIVGICFDKCPEAAFTMLGILKAGCAFLALDPGAPCERKEFIVKDSGAVALMTKGNVLGTSTSSFDILVLNLDNEKLDGTSEEQPSLDRPVTSDDLSYCLYTSGTTGLPKGCAITHGNVTQAMMSFQHLYKRTESSRWLQFASYHFDVSVMEHFWTWSVGMCVVTASRDLVFADLAGTVRKLEISHIDLTPSLARILEPSELPLLAGGVFVVGGEMLRQDILDRWGPTGAIHNAYGPTEATIGVTMFPGVPANGRPANIGRQFKNVGSFVVNPKDPQKPVLRGAVGELCVCGKLVARGYISRPELTEERFIMLDGERTYRTGDLVRILHDETFDFIGRVDDQIKLRGQRLEIGEINSVVKQSDSAVLDVSTLVLKHPKQQKEQLVTFIATERPEQKSSAQAKILVDNYPTDLLNRVRQACQDKLPPYMVPTHVLAVSKMPLSANNKIDAKQLKVLYSELELEYLKRKSISASTKASVHKIAAVFEGKIARALSLTLGITEDQVQMSSTFFELGLDSISVIGLNRALRAEGIQMSTTTIMRNPSVSRLAAVLADAEQSTNISNSDMVLSTKQRIKVFKHRYQATVETTLKLSQDQIEDIAPCTALQQGIISRAIKASDGTYFNQFVFTHIAAEVMGQLQGALTALVKKVQILRTKFVPTEDGYAQVLLRDGLLDMKVLSVKTDAPGPEEDDYLKSRHELWASDAAAAQIFDCLAVVIIQGEKEASLSISLFHAGYDGRSLTLLLDCLLGEFNQSVSIDYGPNFFDVLPHGPLQTQPSARNFWTRFLQDVPLYNEGSHNLLSGHLVERERDLFISQKINDLQSLEACRRSLNVTHQAIFQACWSAVLNEAVGRTNIIGTVLSGSSIDFEGAEKVIGPTFNVVPFYMSLEPESAWRAAIVKCHELNIEILPYQHTPLRDITKWVSKSNLKSSRDLFQTVFVFQRQPKTAEFVSTPWAKISEQVRPDYPLAFEVTQINEESVNITIAAQHGHADHETCRLLMQKFERTLRNIIADPDSRISTNIAVPESMSSDMDSTVHTPISSNSTDPSTISDQDEPDHFAWDETSNAIRKEIAALADLDTDEVSADTSILELGLDSIDSVKLSSRIRARLGIRIAISQLMSALTVRKISTISAKESQQITPSRSSSDFDSRHEQLLRYLHDVGCPNYQSCWPCTHLQEAMIAEMVETDYKRYFNHDVLELDARTDLFALKKAWATVLNSIPLLRSRPVQVEDPRMPMAFAFVEQEDFDPWHTTELHAKVDFEDLFNQIRVEALSARGSEPPFRLTLVQGDDAAQPRYLVLSISHAMYDGWSIGLIHDAVAASYQGGGLPEICRQPSLRTTVSEISEMTESESLSFWQQTLQDAPKSFLPQKPIPTEDQGTSICRLERSSNTNTSSVSDFCKTSHVTVAAFAQTVWSLVLASILGRLDITYGLVLSGRDTEESQRLIFPTMNTVIARSIVHGTLGQMVTYTHQNLVAATEHQHFPLRKATKLSKHQCPEGLFNTLFIYQKKAGKKEREYQKIYSSIHGASDVEYPLCVEAEIEGNDLIWRLASRSDHLTEAESRKILDSLVQLTTKILEYSELESVKFDGRFAQIVNLTPFRPEADDGADDFSPHKSGDDDDSRPWTDVEKKIRIAVAKVSGLDIGDIHRDSDLLSIGLDSISLIKVSALLRDVGVHIRVSDMLKAGNLGRMSVLVKEKTQTGKNFIFSGSASESKVRSAYLTDVRELQQLVRSNPDIPEAKSVLPATAGQVFMLSKWQSHDLYLSDIKFQIEGVERQSTIENAWKRLVDEMQILRANYVATGNKTVPVMQLIPKENSTLASLNKRGEHDKALKHSSSRTSDGWVVVGSSQPVCISVRDIAKGKWEVWLRLSHATYDGYSLHLLLDRLRLLLTSANDGQRIAPLEAHSTYHEKRYADADDTESFWRNYLDNCKASQLLVSPNTPYLRSHLIKPSLATNVKGLRAVARTQGTSLQALFIATWSIIYANMVKSTGPVDEIVVGVFVAARNFEGAENLDLPTLGFVPLRIRAPLQSDVVAIAKGIQKDLEAISENSRSGAGLWQLQDWIGEDFGVDTWVNLILGEGVGGSRLEEDESGVRIIFEESRDGKEIITEVKQNEQAAPEWGLWLEQNVVRGAYKASLDVEATIWKDSIDVGMLSPHMLLDHEGTKKALEQIGADLDTLAGRAAN